ncbi:MAG: LysR family transcriptional regulator [Rhodobiaceae bacterium]|nr:MAG: LysR family transcriptional regulator [Rhodobiaceae bacterium]
MAKTDLNTIPIFVEVIRHNSFSRAADELGITKSKVSKSIAQLELSMGVKLLNRTTRRLKLTEAGMRYYEHALQGLSFIESAENAAAELQQEPKGELKISAPMSFGQTHIAPLIPRFLKQYPEVSIDLVLNDQMQNLLEHGFDLAIRSGDLPDSSLVGRQLCPLKSVLCASPAYLKEHAAPRTPNELKRHNCQLYSYSNPVDQWFFKKAGKQYAVHLSGNYKVNNSEALRVSLLNGIGIGRLPTFVAWSDIKRGRLIQVLGDYDMKATSLYALYPQKQFLPYKVRTFLDFIVMSLGGDAPYWDVPFKT